MNSHDSKLYQQTEGPFDLLYRIDYLTNRSFERSNYLPVALPLRSVIEHIILRS
jgi:hypothetical protein